METKIADVFNRYIHAYYSGDYEKVLYLTETVSLEKYVQKFKDMASAMDKLGESDSLYRMMEVKDIVELSRLSSKSFYKLLLSFMSQSITKRNLKEIKNSISINHIIVNGQLATVEYQFHHTDIFGNKNTVQSVVNLKQVDGDWKIQINEGFQGGFKIAERHLQDFNERKSRDKSEQLKSGDELERVILVGYRKLEDEEIVIEPRFKDGGEFSEGLAYVKVISHYGFIDLSGEIVIRPSFADARDFSEGLAGVQINRAGKWGFINRSGEVVIKPKFDNVTNFSEGRCAVQFLDQWGYIDGSGNVIIDYQYSSASEYFDGTANVTKSSGAYDEEEFYVIDMYGNVINEEE